MTPTSSPKLRAAFVDSTAYFALVRERDDNHREALLILDTLRRERWQLYTTPFVLAEVHALIVNRLHRIDLDLSFLDSVKQSNSTIIVQATIADQQRARLILEQYHDKDFSLVDAISFAVMERLGITHAFTFDRHFTQYGLTALTPSLLTS